MSAVKFVVPVLLLCGSAFGAVSIPETKDGNRDGKPDVWIWKVDDQITTVVSDRNYDGRPDFTVVHGDLDGTRTLVVRVDDFNFDGEMDVMEVWSSGRIKEKWTRSERWTLSSLGTKEKKPIVYYAKWDRINMVFTGGVTTVLGGRDLTEVTTGPIVDEPPARLVNKKWDDGAEASFANGKPMRAKWERKDGTVITMQNFNKYALPVLIYVKNNKTGLNVTIIDANVDGIRDGVSWIMPEDAERVRLKQSVEAKDRNLDGQLDFFWIENLLTKRVEQDDDYDGKIDTVKAYYKDRRTTETLRAEQIPNRRLPDLPSVPWEQVDDFHARVMAESIRLIEDCAANPQ